MKPHHSGIFVWLQEQIIERLGNERAQTLIGESVQHGTKRYQWLQDQMTELGHPDIKEEVDRRIKEDARARFVRDKKRVLKGLLIELETCQNPRRTVWLRKRIQRIEDYLKKQDS
jgi:hypothetical protein